MKSKQKQEIDNLTQELKDCQALLSTKEKRYKLLSLEDLKTHNEKLKANFESTVKKNNELENSLMQSEQKSSMDKAALENARAHFESQRVVLLQENENLVKQNGMYQDELKRINELRLKELKEKGAELSELKKVLSEKNEELGKIENELIGKGQGGIDEKESGTGSLWSHVEQINKVLEERNLM